LFTKTYKKVSKVETSPAKFIFTRWCTGYMHAALILLYWSLTFRAWLGIRKNPDNSETYVYVEISDINPNK
jgi:hypothetical protein